MTGFSPLHHCAHSCGVRSYISFHNFPSLLLFTCVHSVLSLRQSGSPDHCVKESVLRRPWQETGAGPAALSGPVTHPERKQVEAAASELSELRARRDSRKPARYTTAWSSATYRRWSKCTYIFCEVGTCSRVGLFTRWRAATARVRQKVTRVGSVLLLSPWIHFYFNFDIYTPNFTGVTECPHSCGVFFTALSLIQNNKLNLDFTQINSGFAFWFLCHPRSFV